MLTEKGKTMNKTERFSTAQLIPKEHLYAMPESQNMVDYVMREMAAKIASELMGRLERGEKAVRLGDCRRFDDNF